MQDTTITPQTKLVGSHILCTQTNTQVKILEHGEYWNGSEWIDGYFIQYPWGATHVISTDRVGKDYLRLEDEVMPLFRMAA